MPLAWPLLVFLAADPLPPGRPRRRGDPGPARRDDHGRPLSASPRRQGRLRVRDGGVRGPHRPRRERRVQQAVPHPRAGGLAGDGRGAAAAKCHQRRGRSTSSAYGTKIPTYDAKVPMLTLGEDDIRKDSHHAQKMAFLEATERMRARMRAAQPARPPRQSEGRPGQRSEQAGARVLAPPGGGGGGRSRTPGRRPAPDVVRAVGRVRRLRPGSRRPRRGRGDRAAPFPAGPRRRLSRRRARRLQPGAPSGPAIRSLPPGATHAGAWPEVVAAGHHVQPTV